MKFKFFTNFLLLISLVVLTNFLSNKLFFRLDLTSEKKYQLSSSSKELAKNLDDIIYVRVYLKGDFPAKFKHLKNQIKETLDEFKAYANDNIEYVFINPTKYNDKKANENFQRDLYQKGLKPTTVSVNEANGTSKKVIWPGAIFTYKGKALSVSFLKNQLGVSIDQMINSAIESLEYEVSNTINQLITKIKPSVAILEGHGELNQYETAATNQLLSPFYNVERIVLNNNINSLTTRKQLKDSSIFITPKHKVLLIAKPIFPFSEKEKFLIDQYIMYGGRVIWLIDGVRSNIDSLKTSPYTIALDLDLNLSDQLFTYGVRINHDLLQSIQASPIPIVTGTVGGRPKTELIPWTFYPILKSANNHPIVNDLNIVKTEFVSTIDTNKKQGIRKIPLLFSPKYSKVNNTPTRISLSAINIKPDPRQYNKGEKIAAVLISGTFESIFKNRNIANTLKDKVIGFKEQSVPNHMIVVSDGDFIKNSFNRSNGQFLPVGFDRYTGTQYGNNDFILNAVNFLCDDNGLMEVRNKNLKIRLLDKVKLQNDKVYWQIINTIAPIIIIIILGIFYYLVRKRKYTN